VSEDHTEKACGDLKGRLMILKLFPATVCDPREIECYTLGTKNSQNTYVS